MPRLLALLCLLWAAGCAPALNNLPSGDDDDVASDDDDVVGDDDDVADDDDVGMDDDDAVDDDDDIVGDDDDDDIVGDDDDDIALEPIPVDVCDLPPSGNEFQLLEWEITGDFLSTVVEYGGGCEVHDFHLCWDGIFLESWPVQARLVMYDWGPPDPCLALITETLTFDLSPLQDAWLQSYFPPGEVLVNLESGSESYSF